MPKAKTINSKELLQRNFLLKRETVNEEERTVELSFSSETEEVERWFGVEILDHSASSVRLARLSNSGPLLFLHNWDRHIGVIDGVKIESRRGKAVVRFGNSTYAEEKFRDVMDGVLVHVSIGYRVYKMVLEQVNDDGVDVYRAIDWEPYEISLLPVAADTSVGVGRAAAFDFEIEIEERTMDPEEETGGTETQTRAAPTETPTPVNVQEVRNSAREAERTRVADIMSMSTRFAQYGARELADDFIKSDKSPDEFRKAILDNLVDESRAGTGEAVADLGLSDKETRSYSLFKAIRAVVAAKEGDTTYMKKEAAFEMDCSREISERLDRDPKGFFVPLDIMVSAKRQMQIQMQGRALNASNAADLIATEHMDGMFIDALRPNSVVMGLGATVIDGLTGNLEIPRELLTPTFYWLGDDDDVPDSQGSVGMIKMSPKTLAGAVPMSRRLLKQSSLSVEGMVQNALLRGAALGIDIGSLKGSGTNNQPLGAWNHTGVNTQTVATPGKPTWAELVGFETAIDADDALQGKLGYVSTAAVRGNLKTTPKDAGSGLFLMNENGEANGHPLSVTSQLAANDMAFGNWQDLIIGMWGVLDVNPDTATKAKSGGLVLRVFQDADTSIGHPESFCINA
jgi:HK97 family phage major capsid protein